MRSSKLSRLIQAASAATCLLFLAGCGSKKTGNVIVVSVTPGTAGVIVSQSATFNATVTGATNLNVTWKCEYTTTTTTNGKQTTSNPTACNSDTGNIPSDTPEGTTVTYTAPNAVPDQTKYPGLTILITATSVADTKKTGQAKVFLDSGIGIRLTPTTATVPTSAQQQFSVVLTNDLQSKGVTWLLTQQTPNSTNPATPYPQLTTCSPTCGSIDSDGTYTAPSTVPTASTPSGASTTPANLTVVVFANADNTRVATGTITIIAGGPITFNGISPTIAPQGGTLWDIFLDAPNISSASVIHLNGPGGSVVDLTAASGQVKVLFPIPTTAVPSPPSTGARIRLNSTNLASAGDFTVTVTDPAQTVTTNPTGAFTFSIIPVRPSVVASVPDGFVQGSSANSYPVQVDGGYFGPNGALANLIFGGNTIAPSGANARRLNAGIPSNAIDSASPGLYPLFTAPNSTVPPSPNNPAITNLALFPNYSATPVTASQAVAPGAAGTNPSAIDIDPTLGIAVVAQTGSNAVQFYSIGSGSLTPLGAPVPVGQTPTGVSVNRTNHTVAVVNYTDQSVTVVPIPGASSITPFTISLAGLVPITPPPLPYAIGVDPDTNLALVAYSSTAIPTTAKVGFIVNLNQGANPPFGCIDDTSSTKHDGPCVFAQVTLNTGTFPQIAMAPHGHIAYVSPGGSGAVLGIDVTKPSSSVGITSLSLTSGVVTVTTSSAHNLNPGNPGTVLIEGVSPDSGTSANFNGAFSVLSVLSTTQFTYVLNSNLQGNGSGTGGTVFFSQPNLQFNLPVTSQGIAINPITRTGAVADANATGGSNFTAQINLLSALDQVNPSIRFSAGCTAYTTTCSNGAELLGTTAVAWQPYTNAIISYNPGPPDTPVNDLSLSNSINRVSISDPVTAKRYAIVPLTGTGSTVHSATGLKLWGGLAVDPVTNQAIVVQSGSGEIDLINLGPGSTAIKPVQITELLVPSPNPALGNIGGVPGAFVPQGTLTSSSNLAGVQIFGSGFTSGSAQVWLDGVDITTQGGSLSVDSERKITATIPASFLTLPHRYALQVVVGGVQSNPTDFLVIKSVDMTVACTSALPQPSSVAVADQLANGPFAPIAVVSNSGCNNISVIDINPASASFGTVKSSIAVGASPQAVAVSPHFGMAVVANHGDGTASVVNLLTGAQAVPPVTTGSQPSGVAINEGTADALVANSGSNNVSQLNLALLFGSSPATSLTATNIPVDQQPLAVAIDPDRGTNNRGLALVTALQLGSGSSTATVDLVDIGGATPAKTGSVGTLSVSATPTGIVFDPTVSPALFYVSSSGTNTIAAVNPDTGGLPAFVTVGINPTSLAFNPQTGAILTSNSAGKSISIVDTISSPFKTRASFGVSGSPLYSVAIDQFTNMAVIVDQANNRVLLFAMPN